MLTPKQEKFCKVYRETGNASEAYRQSYDISNMNANSIGRKAFELMENVKITARLAELGAATAKKHEITDKWSKNSITLMGIPLHWEHEYSFVRDVKTHIHYIYTDVRSTLTKLQGFYEDYENNEKSYKIAKQKIENKDKENEKIHVPSQSWRWQLAYQLARTAERNKNNKALKDFLNDVKIGVFSSKDSNNNLKNAKHNYFKLLNLAIRLAELEHRNKSKS